MKFSNVVSKIIFSLIAVFAISISVSSAQGISINARAYLQGALINNGFETGTTHDRPLMRDDLRENPFNDARVIPDNDIYQTPLEVNDYLTVDVTSSFEHVGCGTYAQYQTIPDAFTVFSVTGEDAIVDWVFVELRDKNDYTAVVATRSGLIQRDGDIVDLDGTSTLYFNNVATDSYFVVIRHRNHLGVMTKYPKTPEELNELIDFSSFDLGVFDFGNSNNMFNYAGLAMKNITIGSDEIRALWGGDFDADGKVCYQGQNDDLTVIHKEVAGFDMNLNPMFKLDFDQSIGYLQGDFDMNGNTKFDHPNDDTNFILEQVIYYGLNAKVYTNFAHMIEQLP